MTAPPTPARVAPTGHPAATKHRRGDIQGLRAVAVLLVLAYHAGVPQLAGGFVGVDVFFVISGFLITGLIVREVTTTGRLRLARFYARRAKRLLPATAVVFLATAALTVLVLPVTRWAEIAGDIAASAVYLMNWHLADRSVDYLAAGSAASPLQHFWSLAIEEQFYVLWPLLIVAMLWGTRHRTSTSRLTALLLVIVVPSLLWSAYYSGVNPGAAYFQTTTRAWEMGIGALLALHAGRLARAPRQVRQLAGWAGLLAIGYAGLTFDAATTFPGTAALLPTLGTAAVLFSGLGRGDSENPWLRTTSMQGIGELSYSLYLWHWPLLVVATAVWGRVDGTLLLPIGLLVVAASAVPAWLTYRFVERPLHRSQYLGQPRRALVLALTCVGLGLVSAGAVLWALDRESTAVAPAADAAAGAQTLGEDPTSTPAVDDISSTVPSLLDVGDDNADVYADGCHQDQSSPDVVSCTYGDPTSDTTVALIGDSHGAHWQPALRVLAEDNGWRLETYTKSSCLYGDTTVWLPATDGPYTSCEQWQEGVTETLLAGGVDVAVVGSSGSYRAVADDAPLGAAESAPLVSAAMAANWTRLEEAGIEVVALTDTPWMGFDVPDCVAQHEPDLTACTAPRDEAMARSGAGLLELAAEQAPGAVLVDLTDFVCPGDTCVPVIGGVLTYSDGHHLTATYSRTLAPRLEPVLADVLGEGGSPDAAPGHASPGTMVTSPGR
ncbi:acyltransferase family protein [Georgenia sp. MJ173]|uniref:acyltransferase family protein n=1 Tax=Georgenia sunbinii TaxID=3117728 RepID=UPI002F2664B5